MPSGVAPISTSIILIKARSGASIRSILQNGLVRTFFDESFEHQPLRHGNIRGRD
ncbi:hypothetical protein [Bradyrhizobium diazoefficiens]